MYMSIKYVTIDSRINLIKDDLTIMRATSPELYYIAGVV